MRDEAEIQNLAAAYQENQSGGENIMIRDSQLSNVAC